MPDSCFCFVLWVSILFYLGPVCIIFNFISHFKIFLILVEMQILSVAVLLFLVLWLCNKLPQNLVVWKNRLLCSQILWIDPSMVFLFVKVKHTHKIRTLRNYIMEKKKKSPIILDLTADSRFVYSPSHFFNAYMNVFTMHFLNKNVFLSCILFCTFFFLYYIITSWTYFIGGFLITSFLTFLIFFRAL